MPGRTADPRDLLADGVGAALGLGARLGVEYHQTVIMTFDNLLLDRDGAVAILTINRPKV